MHSNKVYEFIQNDSLVLAAMREIRRNHQRI